jgi:hypothetical protein
MLKISQNRWKPKEKNKKGIFGLYTTDSLDRLCLKSLVQSYMCLLSWKIRHIETFLSKNIIKLFHSMISLHCQVSQNIFKDITPL